MIVKQTEKEYSNDVRNKVFLHLLPRWAQIWLFLRSGTFNPKGARSKFWYQIRRIPCLFNHHFWSKCRYYRWKDGMRTSTFYLQCVHCGMQSEDMEGTTSDELENAASRLLKMDFYSQSPAMLAVKESNVRRVFNMMIDNMKMKNHPMPMVTGGLGLTNLDPGVLDEAVKLFNEKYPLNKEVLKQGYIGKIHKIDNPALRSGI